MFELEIKITGPGKGRMGFPLIDYNSTLKNFTQGHGRQVNGAEFTLSHQTLIELEEKIYEAVSEYAKHLGKTRFRDASHLLSSLEPDNQFP